MSIPLLWYVGYRWEGILGIIWWEKEAFKVHGKSRCEGVRGVVLGWEKKGEDTGTTGNGDIGGWGDDLKRKTYRGKDK